MELSILFYPAHVFALRHAIVIHFISLASFVAVHILRSTPGMWEERQTRILEHCTQFHLYTSLKIWLSFVAIYVVLYVRCKIHMQDVTI